MPAERFQVSESVLLAAIRHSQEYLRCIGDRRVAPDSAALGGLVNFQQPFPESSCDPTEVIAELNRFGAPATVATTGGRYFGFVIGGTLPAALGASWLANAWDQNAAYRVMSPVAAELEDVVLKWVCELFGLPKECRGGLVTCATTANFAGLAAARHALLAKQGWNVEEDGMFGAPPIEVVVGEEVHASLLKALGMAGFGRKRVTVVEADEQGRMRAEKLPRLGTNSLVCIQAGNVNTGAYDPAGRSARGQRRPVRGCMWTAHLGYGRLRRRSIGTCWMDSNWRIPGPPTRTNGRTSITTAESCSCETRWHCALR